MEKLELKTKTRFGFEQITVQPGTSVIITDFSIDMNCLSGIGVKCIFEVEKRVFHEVLCLGIVLEDRNGISTDVPFTHETAYVLERINRILNSRKLFFNVNETNSPDAFEKIKLIFTSMKFGL